MEAHRGDGRLLGDGNVAGVGLPSEGIAAAFDDIVRPMIARIHANISNARNLAELRDTLLPRLISGKLRLPEAEREVEDALA